MIFTCIGCFKELVHTEFYKNKHYKSGYASKCKKCYIQQNTAWIKDRPELRKKIRCTYRENGGREIEREYQRKWYTPEKRREYAIKYREKNSKRSLDWYHRQDRVHINQIRKNSNAKRRALKRSSFVENVEILVILELDDGICQLCNKPVEELKEETYTIDHIVPISKGGEHSYTNCQLAHRKCNSMKHNKLIEGTW